VKVVLDTNVFVSGVFFSGPPYQILQAWRAGRIELSVSHAILAEYHRVGKILAEDHPDVDLNPILEFLAQNAEVVTAPPLPKQVCEDPDDDKFLACALAGEEQGDCKRGQAPARCIGLSENRSTEAPQVRDEVSRMIAGQRKNPPAPGETGGFSTLAGCFHITAFSLLAPAAVLAVWELP